MSTFGGFGTGTTGGLFDANKPAGTGFTGFTPTTNTGTGLTFGANTFGNTSNTSTGLFGGTQPATAFGTAQPAPTFGTAQPAPAFGTAQPAPAFGTAQPAPTFGTAQPAPTFGTAQPAPTFGTAQPAPTFGTAQPAPAFGTAQPASAFGTATAAPATTGFSFGAPATSLATATFGSLTANNSATGFGAATAGIGFGAPKTTATPSFVSTSTSFNFGNQNTAPGTTTASFGFGATPAATTQSTGFTFSQPAATSSLSFGLPKTTVGLTLAATPAFSTATSTTPSLSFGLPTSSTTGFSLGSANTGIFGAKTTDNWSLTTATTTTSVGLGGVDNSHSKPGLSGTGNVEPKQVKENLLPDPILQSLNEFQNFTKKQKSISVEISHGSSKPLKKVQEDIEALESLLATITSGLTKNAIAVDKLKAETAQGLHQAEMAQRTHETPPGLEYDNTAPAEYFSDLVTKFETDTMRLRVQMEASEKHLRSLTQSSAISPQELTLAMRRLHETLVVLAARVQTLHTSVQSQKEQYKNLRRVYLKDDTTIFEQDSEQSSSRKPTVYSLRSLTGPSPFSETPGNTSLNLDGLAMLSGSSMSSLVTTPSSTGWMTSLQGATNTSVTQPGAGVLATPQPVENTGFQLSKPPVGNKRNKR